MAVEVHQNSVASSDLGFDLELSSLAEPLPTATARPDASLLRGPYLQQAAPTAITIRWRTAKPTTGLVRYGPDPTTLTELYATEPAPVTDHVVTLGGLSPLTTYHYSIGTTATTLAGGDGTTRFTTPPPPGTSKPTRIWVLGDAGTNTVAQARVRNAFYQYAADRLPDLCLLLGDNAYDDGTDAEFQAAIFDTYPTMLRRSPFWSCLGNHETKQSTAFVDTYPYFDIFTFPTNGEAGGVASGTEHYFSFDYGNIHFISLDSMTASRAPNGAMATWLANDLASTTATWIIAFFHHPPYTKGSHNSDTETPLIEMRQNILPILENGGVDLVLNGHSHCYERSFLLDGHYGLSGTLVPSMKKDAGDGRESAMAPTSNRSPARATTSARFTTSPAPQARFPAASSTTRRCAGPSTNWAPWCWTSRGPNSPRRFSTPMVWSGTPTGFSSRTAPDQRPRRSLIRSTTAVAFSGCFNAS